MKFSFAASLAIVLLTIAILAGCTTSQQTIQYKTIGATEAAVSGAFSAYVDLVAKGKIPTNSVPLVSRAFNGFQAAANTAVVSHNLSLTNLPPDDLVQIANNFILIVNAATGK